jgi:predicted dehydrogenase
MSLTSTGESAIPSRHAELPVVICGAGLRGLAHAQAIRKVPELELRGFYDVQHAARRRSTLVTGLPAFSDLDELLQKCEPHVAVIATPPSARFDLVEQVARSGQVRGIVIEKPIALSLQEAQRIIAFCSEHRIALRIGHQLRFSAEFMRLRQAMRNGELGQLQCVRASCYGNLMDQGAHMIDMLCWLLDGRQLVKVTAQGLQDLSEIARKVRIRPDFVEDQVHPAPYAVLASIDFADGLSASLNSGLLAPILKPTLGQWMQKRVEATGTEGSAEAHVGSHFKLVNQAHPHGLVERTSLEAYTDATRAMHADFAACLQDGAANPAAMQQSMQTAKLLFACLHSSLTGEQVALPLDEGRESSLRTLAHKREAPAQTGAPDRPRLSVIVGMADHRGIGLRALESWTDEQRCDPRDFEVIMILDSRVGVLADALRARLRPWDQCLELETTNEMEQRAIGAQLARGEYLFFTEPHVISEPETVAEAIRFFETQAYAGFCGRSMPIPGKLFTYNETRMFREAFKEWSKRGHWAKVYSRGFGVRKSIYFEVGGFQHRYRDFAEPLIAATLKEKGYELGYAPGVALQHLDADSFPLIQGFVKDFTNGESLFRLEGPPETIRAFFDEPIECNEVRSLNLPLLVQLAKVLLREIVRPHRGMSLRFRLQAAPTELLRLLPLTILGHRLLILRHASRAWVARIRYLFWRWYPDRRYKAFIDWYTSTIAMYRVKFFAEHPGPEVPEEIPQHVCLIDSVTPQDSCGFHSLETYFGRSFRWSSSIAALKIVAVPGEHQMLVQTAGLRWFMPQREIAIYLDGCRLNGIEYDAEKACLKVHVPDTARPPADSQWLILCCTPWRQDNVHRRDVRKLGIPIVSVELNPLV